jgi:hypothetical protein
MVVGLAVNLYAYRTKNVGDYCDVPYHHLNMGLAMYASYFALFINFFYKAYFERKEARKLAAATNKANAIAAAAASNYNKNLKKKIK